MKKTLALVVGMLCLLSVSVARADNHGGAAPGPDLPFVTGEHWSQSTEKQQRAYLYGIGNMLELQQALAGPDGGNDFVSVMIKGLSPMGMDEVIASLDSWYAANPDQGKRPVLEVLYLDIALPRI